ncbi:hypothetical protein D3C72_2270860 [compost metagenome]
MKVAGTEPKLQQLCELGSKHGSVSATDGLVRVDDGQMLFELLVQCLQHNVDSIATRVVGKQLEQA